MMQACHGGLPVAALSVRAAHALALRSLSPNHFAILFAAFFYVPPVYAETINSTVTPVKISDIQRSWGAGYTGCYTGAATEKFPNSFSACNCAKDAWNSESNGAGTLGDAFIDNSSNNISGYCYFRRTAIDGNDLGWFSPANYFSVGSCPLGAAWSADGCYENQYTCPSTGGWILSADQQACSRCSDPNLPILTAEGAYICSDDKGAGPPCEQPPGSSSQPNPFWSSAP